MIERLSLWGLTGTPRTDIVLPGSPERCLTRLAVEDGSGRVWVLERLLPGQEQRRERIGAALARLAEAGLPVAPYLPGPDGRFCLADNDHCYQLAPFIAGDPLPRPEFIHDPARGEALGRFLADLCHKGVCVTEFDREPRFSLEDYVNELMGAMRLRQPDLFEALSPVPPVLAPLFEAWPDLPAGLAQGDFHPLNVIWHGTGVGAVIDWEFAGIRPLLFDAANCLGCIGIEEPPALVRGLAPALLQALHRAGCLDRTSLALLPELLLALRFAWMSEWLRRRDTEMIEHETRYMRLLANSLDTLLPAWHKVIA